MIEIKYTEKFEKWLRNLKDSKVKGLINLRLNRMRLGNFGDCKPVGSGVSEIRIHHGAGYRVYYCQCGDKIVVLLCGGDKSSQSSDIQQAKEMKKCLTNQLLN